jgi:hypothetical protein
MTYAAKEREALLWGLVLLGPLSRRAERKRPIDEELKAVDGQ